MIEKKFYLTNCVNSTAEAINVMTDQAVEITYKTFMKHVKREEVARLFPDYEWSGKRYGGGLHIKNDWHISYYKSVYKGMPCVYMCHSAIEYIFVGNN